MHILYLVHQYMPEHVGGTELYTHSLAHALSRRGHQVTVFHRRDAEGIAADSREEYRTEEDVPTWAAWTGSLSPTRRFLATFGNPSLIHTFERVLDETEPDLIHIQHLMGLPVALVRSIRRKGLPFIVTLNDYWWVCANANLLTNYNQQVCDGPQAYLNCARCALARVGRPRLWPVLLPVAGLLARRNYLLARVLRAAHGLIAPTEFVHRWYTAHGVPAERLQVIPPGLEHVTVTPRRTQGASGPVRLAYIGGLSWQKGVHVLVGAFGGIHGVAELWIAGDESFDPAYVARLHAQATPGVRFLGRLTRDQVWEILAQVDIVAVPSLCYESFSFIVSEAFAAGVPVVASRLGPLAERVHDDVDGLLVLPGDTAAWRTTLQRLVDEPDLLDRLRASVRPPMTLDEHVDRIETLYVQLVDGNRRRQSAS